MAREGEGGGGGGLGRPAPSSLSKACSIHTPRVDPGPCCPGHAVSGEACAPAGPCVKWGMVRLRGWA